MASKKTKKPEQPEVPVHYTDAYYGKEGYRTKQYAAKLELSGNFGLPIDKYEFNEFPNRRERRRVARRGKVFKLGIWKRTTSNLKNIQTFVKEEKVAVPA